MADFEANTVVAFVKNCAVFLSIVIYFSVNDVFKYVSASIIRKPPSPWLQFHCQKIHSVSLLFSQNRGRVEVRGMPRDLYVVASVLSIKIHSSASNVFYQLISIVFASVKFVDVETLNLNCFCCTLLGFLGVKQ